MHQDICPPFGFNKNYPLSTISPCQLNKHTQFVFQTRHVLYHYFAPCHRIRRFKKKTELENVVVLWSAGNLIFLCTAPTKLVMDSCKSRISHVTRNVLFLCQPQRSWVVEICCISGLNWWFVVRAFGLNYPQYLTLRICFIIALQDNTRTQNVRLSQKQNDSNI